VLIMLWLLVVIAPLRSTVSAAAANPDSQTFTYTGSEQTFEVPDGVNGVAVTAVGAPGGSETASGGDGSVATAIVPVTAGQTLYIEVGGPGATRDNSGDAGKGGWNGGGYGGLGGSEGSFPGAGGGGASDVRTDTISDTPETSLASRLVVAAGGGGGGGDGIQGTGPGGAGDMVGSPTSNCDEDPGPGCGGGAGTTTVGGNGGLGGEDLVGSAVGEAGTLGTGGVGGNPSGLKGSGGGGGGGGWYGGGGGGSSLTETSSFADAGGGGGGGASGFASDATDTAVTADTSGIPSVTIVWGYTLTVMLAGTGDGSVSDGGSITCPTSQCSVTYSPGDTVTLTAHPHRGSTFAGWSGDGCSDATRCPITMTGNQRITATFEKIKPPATKVTSSHISSKTRKATFAFTATGPHTGFQCSLTKTAHHARFVKCTSPAHYKHLAKTSYLFQVRAIGPGGTDPTPATHRFKIT
jgi:hypothetical protein